MDWQNSARSFKQPNSRADSFLIPGVPYSISKQCEISAMTVPINSSAGVKLEPSGIAGIARATVTDFAFENDLPWDRFVRLKRVAEVAENLAPSNVLDAGGYDGAIAFFLKCARIDVVDSATTGGSVLNIPVTDRYYDLVTAIDVLEHIAPAERILALSEIARVANKYIVLNYPCRDSKEAQELTLKLTHNQLIREHVEWELPDSNWVTEELAKCGFQSTITPHTSIAIWLGQYLTLNLVPEAAKQLNRHLVENYPDEPTTKYLYHLVICERI